MRTTHQEVDLQLVVTSTTMLGDAVRLLTLARTEGTDLPEWSPGAHIDLDLGGSVRQYSLCGPLASRHQWQVAVLREPRSRGASAFAHDTLEVGTLLSARGPRNHFPLDDATHHRFVAGGIGVTPFLPMLEELDRRGTPFHLTYGGRTRESMAFADDLVERYAERVRLVPEDEEGLLPIAQVLDRATDGTAVYCCGPEGLIRAVENLHSRVGRGTLHVERFSPREVDDPPARRSFEVEARRSGLTVVVDESTSILDALEGAGLRPLSSCREGICGTCEVFVLDGQPDHRDSILTEDERRANETMFPCVSRCLSPRLALDV